MIFGISVDISDCTKMLPLIEKYSDIIKHIQIYLDNSSFDVMQRIIARILDKRISYSFHAYGNLNMADTSQYNTAIQTIDMLSSINGVFVNFHVGYYYSNKQCRDNALNNMIKMTNKLCIYAYHKKIAIHMENDIRSADGCERLETILSDWVAIHQIDQPNFYMCYDIGHANISFGNAFMYRKFISKIGSFHIHNNDGINDLHIPFGNHGTIRLNEVLSELRQTDKYVILENSFDGYNNALEHLCVLYNNIII
jgi:sugar phosphate isomerase/epimerase